MKIQRYLLLLSNEYGNVLQSFWHPYDKSVKREDVIKLATEKGWLQPGDTLEWQMDIGKTEILLIP